MADRGGIRAFRGRAQWYRECHRWDLPAREKRDNACLCVLYRRSRSCQARLNDTGFHTFEVSIGSILPFYAFAFGGPVSINDADTRTSDTTYALGDT